MSEYMYIEYCQIQAMYFCLNTVRNLCTIVVTCQCLGIIYAYLCNGNYLTTIPIFHYAYIQPSCIVIFHALENELTITIAWLGPVVALLQSSESFIHDNNRLFKTKAVMISSI